MYLKSNVLNAIKFSDAYMLPIRYWFNSPIFFTEVKTIAIFCKIVVLVYKLFLTLNA